MQFPLTKEGLAQGFTKDQLVEAHRKHFGFVGDSARTSKDHYAEALAGLSADQQRALFPDVDQDKPIDAPPTGNDGPAYEPEDGRAGDGSGKDGGEQSGEQGSGGGQPEKQPRKPLDPVSQAIADAIADEVAERAKAKLEADGVGQSSKTIIQLPEAGKTRELDEETHPLFEKVLRLVQAELNVMLVGPAGCGKSYLGGQVARALDRQFGTLHCTAGASESQLTGWLLPVGDQGRFEYAESQFVRLYREGNSLFLLDELDAADPNVMMVLNGALANGHIHVPHNLVQPTIARGEHSAIMAAANTFGTGATVTYQGRNALDGATLDRFYIVGMDYDPRLEARIAGLPVPKKKDWKPADKPSDAEIADLGKWVLGLRDKVGKLGLRRIVSTRTMQKAVAARLAGIPAEEVKKDLLAGWTKDELTKVGEVV